MTRAEHDKRYAEKQVKVDKIFKEEQNMGTLEKTIEIGNDRIEIWRYGVDDYSMDCLEADCSVRGSFVDIVVELINTFGVDALEQYATK